MAVDPLPLANKGFAAKPSLIWRRGSQNTHGQFPRARWWLSKSETARIPFLADWPCTTAGGYFGFWLTSAVRCSGTFVAFRRELFWCLVLLVVFYIFYFFHRPLRPQTPDRSTTLPPADRQPQTSPLNSPETSPESPSHTPQTKTD